LDKAAVFLSGTKNQSGQQVTSTLQPKSEPAVPVSAVVRPDLTWSVEGVCHIPRIFGATVNGSSRGEAVEKIRALNLNSARAFLWALGWWQNAPTGFVAPPVTPGVVQQYGHKNGVSEEEAKKQYALFFQQDFHRLMRQWWLDAAGSVQVQQAGLFEQWGLTKGLVFHLGGTPDDGLVINHPEGLNRFYDAYIEAIREFHPVLDIDFVQLSNEPNYPHFAWSFDTQREASEAWIAIYNQLDSYLRKKGLRTRLLGPCLASGTFFSWGGWQDWSVPVLRDTEYPLTHFNYHCYNTPAYTHLAWQEMLHAQADLLGKPRPRAVVTEMNYRLKGSAKLRF
jgi:hypothetical protein